MTVSPELSREQVPIPTFASGEYSCAFSLFGDVFKDIEGDIGIYCHFCRFYDVMDAAKAAYLADGVRNDGLVFPDGTCLPSADFRLLDSLINQAIATLPD